jgi:protein FRG1
MVKPLLFKGDKKPKKRKRVDVEEKFGDETTGKEVSTVVEEDAPADDDR